MTKKQLKARIEYLEDELRRTLYEKNLVELREAMLKIKARGLERVALIENRMWYQ